MFRINRIYGATMLALLSVTSGAAHATITTDYVPSRININHAPYGNLTNITIKDLNNQGNFIGHAKLPAPESHWEPKSYIWKGPTQLELLPHDPSSDLSNPPRVIAEDLNDNGMAVGLWSGVGHKNMLWDTTTDPISYGLVPDSNGSFIYSVTNDNRYLGRVGQDPALLVDGFYTPYDVSGYFTGQLIPKINSHASLIAHKGLNATVDGGVYKPFGGSPTFFTEDEPGGFNTVLPIEINDNEMIAGMMYHFTTRQARYHSHSCYYTDMSDRSKSLEFDGNILAQKYNFCSVVDLNNNNIAAVNLRSGQDYSKVGLLYDINDDTHVELKTLIKTSGTGTSILDFAYLEILHINDNGDMIVQAAPNTLTAMSLYYLEALNPEPDPDPEPDPEPDPDPEPETPITLKVDNDAEGNCWSHDWLVIHGEIALIIPLDADTPHWTTQTTLAGYHDADYQIAAQDGMTESSFDWTIDITETRNYELFASWPADDGNDNSVTYQITSDDGTCNFDFEANQTQENPTGYASMTTCELSAGSRVSVKLIGSGSNNLIADEIKLQSL